MSGEERLEELHVIERTTNHMAHLLDNVLTLSKGEAGKLECHPESIEVRQFCQRLVERFQAISEDSHTIELSAECPELQVSVDQKLLEHILSNLLSNAIKYSPAGGAIFFELVRKNEDLIFRIKDEGIGIPEADQAHLFEAFHRGMNVDNIEGTGLGLSIVKQFVDLHDGTISVESSPGNGATFTVTLPCCA